MGKMHLQCMCIVKHIGISNKKQFWSVFPRLKCTYCIQWTDPDRGGRVGGRSFEMVGAPGLESLSRPYIHHEMIHYNCSIREMPCQKGSTQKPCYRCFPWVRAFILCRTGGRPRGRFTFFTEKSKNLISHHHIHNIITVSNKNKSWKSRW